MLNRACIFFLFMQAFSAFAYESFSDYCIDCEQGANKGFCTPEIKKTVEAIHSRVNAPSISGKSRCFMTNISLRQLPELDLSGSKIIDLSPLAQLRKLNSLNLANNEIFDLDPVSRLTDLNQLNLESNQIADIRPISGLRHLQTLNLAFNYHISDINRSFHKVAPY